MKPFFWALAGLALGVSMPAVAAGSPEGHGKIAAPRSAQKSAAKADGKKTRKAVAKPVAGTDTAPQDAAAAARMARVAEWVAASADNRGLPYAIIDKPAATLQLFDGKGAQVAQVPVLLGRAPGDLSTPGIGAKSLAEIGPAEKTTPAGRFLARFGIAAGKAKVLWVDYADSVALHPIPPGASPKERRRQRLLSPASDDNRITFGCINVPQGFYSRNLRPAFERKGGYVYILPDAMALEDVFPLLRTMPYRPAMTAAKADPQGGARPDGPAAAPAQGQPQK
ncbi:MAG: hypothetical protein RIS94_984 [Pseudomonadota bacterium]|jgi:hypothetical protein